MLTQANGYRSIVRVVGTLVRHCTEVTRHCTVLYSTLLYTIKLYFTVQNWSELNSTSPYRTDLNLTLLHFTELISAKLHCNVHN